MADSSNSWWISSHLTGSDNHQYMVLSHVLATDAYGLYRDDIYDITEPAYAQFSEMTTTQVLAANSQDGKVDTRTTDFFFFGSVLANNSITKLRTADAKGHRRWATTQSDAGINNVQPVSTVDASDESWTSPHTNATYDQAWTIVLQDSTTLTVQTTDEDQELWAASGFATYEGFATVTGINADGECVTGFGLVEIQGVF
ncbi:uncharacterized protein BDV17DRAFT_288999 [Aspergillus undulatus]|uniref:uncharacterized protein n=1 Tax=Aspergillus undulatus TaxID=1810928 RepID=UPI003CCDA840